MSAQAYPGRLHHPTAIAYRPMEWHRSSRAQDRWPVRPRLTRAGKLGLSGVGRPVLRSRRVIDNVNGAVRYWAQVAHGSYLHRLLDLFRISEVSSITIICEIVRILDLYALRSRLTEIHQFPDGMIFETLRTQAPLELLDRDLAGEAVIGAVKADQTGDDPLQKRHAVGENGLQNGLLALE